MPDPALDTPPTARRGPGRPRKTPAQRDDGNRRRELLTAAARLFRQRGFDATSTRDLAAAAGMQSGSPFYHFPTKADLLFAVMQQGMLDAIERQDRLLRTPSQHRPPPAQPSAQAAASLLADLVRHHCRILHGRGQDFIQVMLHEWRALDRAQQRQLTAMQRAYEAPWVPVMAVLHANGQLGCEPRLARQLLFGALNWSMHWFNPRKGASATELGDALLALVLRPSPAAPLSTACPTAGRSPEPT